MIFPIIVSWFLLKTSDKKFTASMTLTCLFYCLLLCNYNSSLQTRSTSSWALQSQCTLPFVYVQLLSHIQLFVTPWTVACQASLSVDFSRQEYSSGLPFPPPKDPPFRDRIRVSALVDGFFITESPGKPLFLIPSSKLSNKRSSISEFPVGPLWSQK